MDRSKKAVDLKEKETVKLFAGQDEENDAGQDEKNDAGQDEKNDAGQDEENDAGQDEKNDATQECQASEPEMTVVCATAQTDAVIPGQSEAESAEPERSKSATQAADCAVGQPRGNRSTHRSRTFALGKRASKLTFKVATVGVVVWLAFFAFKQGCVWYASLPRAEWSTAKASAVGGGIFLAALGQTDLAYASQSLPFANTAKECSDHHALRVKSVALVNRLLNQPFAAERPLAMSSAATNLLQLGQYSESLRYVDQVLAHHPDSVQVRQLKALILANSGDCAQALKELDLAASLCTQSENQEYMRSGLNEEAAFAALTAGQPERALRYLDKSDTERALRYRSKNEVGDSYFNGDKAEIYLLLHQGQTVIDYCNKALNSKYTWQANSAHYYRGLAYLQANSIASAENEIKLIKLPNDSTDYTLGDGKYYKCMLLSKIAATKGDFKLAVKKLGEIPEDQIAVHERLYKGQLLNSDHDYPRALDVLDQAIALMTNSQYRYFPDLHLTKAKSLNGLKRYKEALSELQSCLRFNPRSIEAYKLGYELSRQLHNDSLAALIPKL